MTVQTNVPDIDVPQSATQSTSQWPGTFGVSTKLRIGTRVSYCVLLGLVPVQAPAHLGFVPLEGALDVAALIRTSCARVSLSQVTLS